MSLEMPADSRMRAGELQRSYSCVCSLSRHLFHLLHASLGMHHNRWDAGITQFEHHTSGGGLVIKCNAVWSDGL